ncbi:MAG: acyl-CoA-binding protein [Gammaproteobacteria bacterium]|nr:acyl-CoA-binding protein [Gammaproteobacteria bacterium]
MSDELKAQFEAATVAAKALPRRPGNDDMLEMYALYKQATAGDVSGERPGGFDFVGAAKFDAWTGLKGVSNEEAMQRYIDKVESLKS